MVHAAASSARVATYIPLGLELLEALELAGYRLVGQQRLVLAQRALANLRVLGLGDGILEEGLLELVEGDDDAEELGEGVVQVALGAGARELDFLRGGSVAAWARVRRRSSHLVEVDGRGEAGVGHVAMRRGRIALSGHHGGGSRCCIELTRRCAGRTKLSSKRTSTSTRRMPWRGHDVAAAEYPHRLPVACGVVIDNVDPRKFLAIPRLAAASTSRWSRNQPPSSSQRFLPIPHRESGESRSRWRPAKRTSRRRKSSKRST